MKLRDLQRIVQEVNKARDLDGILRIIVREIHATLDVDATTVHLRDEERREFVMLYTEGLNRDVVGRIRLGEDEGLIGLVNERAEVVNLDDAMTHPRFKHVAEVMEESLHAFLGVPIIHQRKVLGVLVVQRREARRFGEDTVSFLVTLAAQLATAIAHARLSGGESVTRIRHSPREKFITGVGGSPGVAIGKAVVVYPEADLDAVPDRQVSDTRAEKRRFRAAVKAVRDDIHAIQKQLEDRLPEEERMLFEAYVLLLGSNTLVEGVIRRIGKGNWAQGALREVIAEHVARFEQLGDAYFRERADDIREIGRRILMKLQQTSGQKISYPRKTVLVGEEIGATQLAEVPVKHIVGVVSARGSISSHVAILARAMGIPAVMGAEDLDVGRIDDKELVVDGYQGRVYVEPSPVVRREYARLARQEDQLSKELEALRDEPARTPDGHEIKLMVNSGLLADLGPSAESGADGIGLYRTEFPFMVREAFPGENEQSAIYQQVLRVFHPRPVVLRTLDVGGDKPLPYFPFEEDNPFLGWRGIRLMLDHPEIFLTQLRAMLIASSHYGNARILFPMISDLNELDEALRLLNQAHCELIDEGIDVQRPQVGVMIEVPSAVYQSDALARRVDFLSIGSNDLTQYLLAVDRNNARVAKLYDALHPAVLRAILQVVAAGAENHTPVSVCGEMAGDPAAAILLLGMGIDSLSMSVASLPRIKWVIRSFTSAQARELLDQALEMEDAASIRSLANNALENAGLGGLVRAGR